MYSTIAGRRRHVERGSSTNRYLSGALRTRSSGGILDRQARQLRIPLWGSLLHKRLSIAAAAGVVCKLREGEREGFHCSRKDATFFVGWGLLLSGWDWGGEKGRISLLVSVQTRSHSQCCTASAAWAVLSCVNAERGGKLGRHGGERTRGKQWYNGHGILFEGMQRTSYIILQQFNRIKYNVA